MMTICIPSIEELRLLLAFASLIKLRMEMTCSYSQGKRSLQIEDKCICVISSTFKQTPMGAASRVLFVSLF